MRPSSSVFDLATRRLALPEERRGLIETERVLAAVRAVLVLTSILLVRLRTEEFPYGDWVYALLIFYLAHSLGLLVVLRWRTDISPGFSLFAHAGDIVWPAFISVFAGGLNSPFFLYFIFALLAAAFRWGMRETSLTTVAVIVTMAADALIVTRTPLAQVITHPFDVTNFVMRVINLVIFSFLIGYISESEKRRAAEALSISHLSSGVQVEAGLKGTVQNLLGELLRLFEASELLIVTREAVAAPAMLWRAERTAGDQFVFTWRQLEHAEEGDYFFPMGDASAGVIWRRGSRISSVTLDKSGARTYAKPCELTPGFVAQHRFDLLLGCVITAAPDVSTRALMFNPRRGGRAESQLRFLQDLANLIAPSVYNVYLLRRLRSRAAAVARARVSRELHDGVVQSLHAIAFRLYALRTRSAISPVEREQELLEVQQLVQNEAANLRQLIQQLEPLDFDPRHLTGFLAGMVTRYRQDTGISAQFVCDVADVSLPPAACREIAGIVREALVNVRRHSGAQNVLVRLSRHPGAWMLTIEDDGHGFQFSGRFSHVELDEFRRGPLVIKQRVRAIGGELTIISQAGRGARLEIRIPDMARAIA